MSQTYVIDSELNNANCFLKLKTELQQSITPSPEDAFCVRYFRSKAAVRKERARQLSISSFVIHPCSKFRRWYEVYLIFLYTSVLVTKPLDAGFFKTSHYKKLSYYKEYTLITDFLCWIDIAVNFITGFAEKESKTTELRPVVIAKRYVCSSFFVCDILSSVPKSIFSYEFIQNVIQQIHFYRGLVSIFCLFKIVRLISLLVCIDDMAYYVKANSKGAVFFLCSLVTVLFIVHWMACLQFFASRVIRAYFFRDFTQKTWISRGGLSKARLIKQYIYAVFKSLAYILGVRISNIYEEKLPEEYVIAIITYIIGKILVICVWVVLAISILESRSTSIKFAEIINQVDEYMRQKELPLNLRDKISHYYRFKYQGKYFKEKFITGILSSNIRNELNIRVCRSLVANVSLFSILTDSELDQVVQYLIPEIFLPNDVIFRSGTQANAMYFLSSGTVAVYTRSGKEVCHLEDGAYFGDLSLILKGKRSATVVAIETCQVYKLKKTDFERYLLINETVLKKMMQHAEEKLRHITEAEEDYQKVLFEKTFKET